MFASVLLLVLGSFNLIDRIAAVANSHVFIANAHYMFGDLRAWGWITLIPGALQLLAAAGVLARDQLARWFAVAVVGLNAIGQIFFISRLPVLVPDHHRRGRGRAVRAVRLRQPPERDRMIHRSVSGSALRPAVTSSRHRSPGPWLTPSKCMRAVARPGTARPASSVRSRGR